jgi:geranylgeranyl diphosphate synthase type I
VWDIWGEAQAINAGDGMYTLSRIGAAGLTEKGHTPQKVLDFIRLLDKTCLTLCEGQYSDMCFETRYYVNVDEYMEMISKKTANLISCSIKAGAMLGTDNKSLVADMGRFGFNMGMAFQIQDDILGIWGVEDKTGKSSSDIAQRKKSLPIVYALQSENSECENVIRSVYDKEKIVMADEKSVVAALDDIEASDYCERLAHKYYDNAIKSIGSARIDDEVRDEFLNIASFIVKRDY